MKYLLDTAVFLWGLDEQHKLNTRAQEILQNRNEEIFLSPIITWEIVIKQGRGKLKLARPVADMVERASTQFGAHSLPITHLHSLALTELPPLHNDPFDRMLIAQARSENLVFMTADSLIRNYPVETLWCGK